MSEDLRSQLRAAQDDARLWQQRAEERGHPGCLPGRPERDELRGQLSAALSDAAEQRSRRESNEKWALRMEKRAEDAEEEVKRLQYLGKTAEWAKAVGEEHPELFGLEKPDPEHLDADTFTTVAEIIQQATGHSYHWCGDLLSKILLHLRRTPAMQPDTCKEVSEILDRMRETRALVEWSVSNLEKFLKETEEGS